MTSLVKIIYGYYSLVVFTIVTFSGVSFSVNAKTVVLGFDGMDPVLLENWMSEGHLPHFTELKKQGYFAPLQTTNPAQSPVAWSTFATGLNPGQHGIFDFIHRNPKTMGPDYSISGIKTTQPFELFGAKLPYNQSVIYNKRVGKPFWLSAEQMGKKSSVLRVPATYPPDDISHMLAGMGVPDLLGTQGTFSYYSTKYIDPNTTGGRIIRVSIKEGQISTELSGPNNPLSDQAMTIPILIKPNNQSAVNIDIGGQNLNLSTGQWSEWIQVKFTYGGIFSVSGLIRIYLEEAFPRFKMYVSPINVDPHDPIVPISSPPQFAAQLSEEIGLFHTLGMPEETWSLNDGLIDDDTYLDMIKTILAEREAMFFHELKQADKELVVGVFVQTDRVSHMFWRGYDDKHPGYANASDTAKNAILWIYQEADRILGETMQQIDGDDRLLVLSDHGFAPYYYHVNINKWLHDNGYLILKNNSDQNEFKATQIDWSKTKAYAMGLNGIYANLAGREEQGWLDNKDADSIIYEISESLKSLKDPRNQQQIVRQTYTKDEAYSGLRKAHAPDLVIGYNRGYRASWQTVLGGSDNKFITVNNDKWSGDHCIDPELVPGIIMTNFIPINQLDHIKDIAPEVLSKYTNQDNEYQINEPLGLFDFVFTGINRFNQILLQFLPFSVVMILGGIIFVLWQSLLMKSTLVLKKVGLPFNLLRWCIGLFSACVFLLVFHLQKEHININNSPKITIQAIATVETTLPLLKWQSNKHFQSPPESSKYKHNSWTINQDVLSEQWELIENDGTILYVLSTEFPLRTKTKPNWTHNIISSPVGYIHPSSQIDHIKVTSNDKNIRPLLGFILGVVLTYIFLFLLRRYLLIKKS